MDAETLPFSISPEAQEQLLHYLDFIKSGHDRAHIPVADRGFPSLFWSIGTQVGSVPVGPDIGLGMSRSLNDAGEFSFTVGPYRIWVSERTLSLLQGRTLTWECRIVSAPIERHYCFWVDPPPSDA